MKRLLFSVLCACKGVESPQVATIDRPSGDAEVIEAAPAPVPDAPDAGSTKPIASETRANVPSGGATPTIKGGLGASEVATVIASHRPGLKACYNKKLAADPSYAGKVIVEIEITPGGRVSKARTVSSTFPDADMPACIEQEVQKWMFPQSSAPTQVALPVVFVSPSGP